MSDIQNFLQEDHRNLAELFADAEAMAQAGDWDSAELGTIRFARALREHILMEEELLFPLLQTRSPIAGPCQLLQQEHQLIVKQLEALFRAVQDRSGPLFRHATEALREVLLPHNQRENGMLYPLADQVLPDAAEHLVKQMRMVRRPQGGCGGGGGHCACSHGARA